MVYAIHANLDPSPAAATSIFPVASDVSASGGPETTPLLAFNGSDQTLIVGDNVLKTMRPSSEIDAPYCIPEDEVTVSGTPTTGLAPSPRGTRKSVMPPTVEPSE